MTEESLSALEALLAVGCRGGWRTESVAELVAEVRNLQLSLAETKQDCRRLLDELDRLKTGTYCPYCGFTVSLDAEGSVIGEHIRTCVRHPMRAVEKKNEVLENALRQVRVILRQRMWGGTASPSHDLLDAKEADRAMQLILDALTFEPVEVPS